MLQSSSQCRTFYMGDLSTGAVQDDMHVWLVRCWHGNCKASGFTLICS